MTRPVKRTGLQRFVERREFQRRMRRRDVGFEVWLKGRAVSLGLVSEETGQAGATKEPAFELLSPANLGLAELRLPTASRFCVGQALQCVSARLGQLLCWGLARITGSHPASSPECSPPSGGPDHA